MESFFKRLRGIDKGKIRSLLEKSTTPVYESRVLKTAFPDMDIQKASPLVLYRNHFLLFHLLYQMQDEYYRQGQYLHIHFMRIFLTPYPDSGRCRYYDENLSGFCFAPCVPETNYCGFHRERIRDTAIAQLSDRFFYLDTDNYDKLNEETASAFLSGAWELLTHWDTYRKSLKVMDLPENPDIRMVKQKFRHLAKLHHPDKGAQNAKEFKRINNAYRMIMRIQSLRNTPLK